MPFFSFCFLSIITYSEYSTYAAFFLLRLLRGWPLTVLHSPLASFAYHFTEWSIISRRMRKYCINKLIPRSRTEDQSHITQITDTEKYGKLAVTFSSVPSSFLNRTRKILHFRTGSGHVCERMIRMVSVHWYRKFVWAFRLFQLLFIILTLETK